MSRITSGSSMLGGDRLSGDSTRSVLTTTSTYSSSSSSSQAARDDKYGGHSAGSKTPEPGFQYEDIQSFRERRKLEGDGLQLQGRRLSGNIVGSVSKDDGASDIATSDSGYSSGIAADLEKSRDGDVHRYTSSVREYKSYGASQGDRLARDAILGDSKSSGITSSDYKSTSVTSKDGSDLLSDRYSREKLLADARSRISDKSYLSDYKSSDIGRSRSYGDGKTRSTDLSSRLYGRSSTTSPVPRDDRFSRTDALVAKYLDPSRYKSKRGSDIASDHKHLTGIKEEGRETGRRQGDRDVTREKHHSVSGKPMSYLPIDTSYQDLLKQKKEQSSILDKNRDTSRFTYGDTTSKSANISSSSSGIGGRDNFTSRMSYDLQDSRRSRDDAIDRLLNKTRRYSSDSILDKTSDKKFDDVIGAMTNKDLDSSTSHVSRSRYGTPYTSLDHSHYRPSSTSREPEEGIYDRLRRGSGPLERPSSGLGSPKRDNYRGSIDGLDQPVYDRLYSSSSVDSRPSKGVGSPVPMSDRFGLPLDKYDKPVPLHGKDIVNGREIVSRYTERPRYGDIMSDDRTNVRETTRTSVMQRSFVSRNGEVIKDEVQRHDEIRHGGQNAIEGTEGKYGSPELTSRIQRYPAVKKDDAAIDGYRREYDSRNIEDVRRVRDTDSVTSRDQKLNDIMKLTGLNDTGDMTNYQERSRRDDVTRIHDDSNIRTKVHRTDVNTNVNIFKEISAPKRDRPSKSGKLGIADLKSKIEALTKSVDELMDLKKKTTLKSYVKEHAERRPSSDLVETLPKIDRYEIRSKRYEPKDIGTDHVDYVYKKLDLEEMPQRPEKAENVEVELNIQSLWLSEEQRKGKDVSLIPRQIELAPENRSVEWWNAATAEEADRFLCIGDWRWWNASTTEGVDNILGVQAIDKETGMAGAIIAKYQGEEKPLQWAWIEAANQPTAAEKRQTLTRVLKIDKEDLDLWDGKTSSKRARNKQRMGIGDMQWWDANTAEGVEQQLTLKGSNEETRTILATYDEGTKPTAWSFVETSQSAPGIQVNRRHSISRSSRDIYVDERDNGKVELLIRVKDEETQDPRFISIRPGPVEKAIIVHQAVESELPYTKNIWAEGQQGDGFEVTDGVVQMKIQDLTPQEREAWAHIMGMEHKEFKLQENQTFEIPVKFVDTFRKRLKKKEDLYAVPSKKNKRKPLFGSTRSVKSVESEGKKKQKKSLFGSTRSVKSVQEEKKEKKKLEGSKSVGFDSTRKEKKETDSERKKKESKRKKLEAENKKKEEMEKKKKEELEKKKREEKMKLEKKKESERKKEKEKERKKMEQQKKKGFGSVKKEKDVAVESPPPLVDRTNKPITKEDDYEYNEEIRRYSDAVDAEIFNPDKKRLSNVEVTARDCDSETDNLDGSSGAKLVTKAYGASFSPKRSSSPFAINGKGPLRPHSAKAKMTSYVQSQNSKKTVIEEHGGNITRQINPSVKSVTSVNATQNNKNQSQSSGQTNSVKHKSGSLQRRSAGSSIAVALRGGGSKQSNGSVKVVNSQNVQNQMSPGQNIRQTTVQESHSYRTETHITNTGGTTNAGAFLPQIPPMQPAIGNVGPGHFSGGQGNVGAGHIGFNQSFSEQTVEGGVGAQHVEEQEHVGVRPVSSGQGIVGASHFGVSQVNEQAEAGGVGVQHVGGQEHVEARRLSTGQGNVGANHIGFNQVVTEQTRAGGIGLQHVGGQTGGGHVVPFGLHNLPKENTTDYSHESGVQQLPDGSIVKREVSRVRQTSWAVEDDASTSEQTKF